MKQNLLAVAVACAAFVLAGCEDKATVELTTPAQKASYGIGLNLPSGEMGRKDLIKIENTFLTDEQVNQLSLYAPQATVNRIDDYEVVGKSRPSLPDRIDSVLVCPNSNCISHAEPVSSSFAVKKRADDIALKCKYCEKEFSHYVVLAN